MVKSLDKWGNVVLWFLSLSVVVVIASTSYKFLFQKDYDVTFETSCDPALEQCFSRDCSTEECPPNLYDSYSIYTLPARDFFRCTSVDCINECKTNQLECMETLCGEAEEDMCSSPISQDDDSQTIDSELTI